MEREPSTAELERHTVVLCRERRVADLHWEAEERGRGRAGGRGRATRRSTWPARAAAEARRRTTDVVAIACAGGERDARAARSRASHARATVGLAATMPNKPRCLESDSSGESPSPCNRPEGHPGRHVYRPPDGRGCWLWGPARSPGDPEPRLRRQVALTLLPEARKVLDELAKRENISRSAIV